MTDKNTPGDKTLHMAQTKTLSLKRPVEQGVVRQSFSHGRTKAVVVEKVKRRIVGPGEAPAAPEPVKAAPQVKAAAAAPAPTPQPARPATPPAAQKPSGMVLRTLTEDERETDRRERGGVAGDTFAGALQAQTHTDTATESGDADAESGGQAGVTQGSGIKLVGGESHGSHTQQGHGVQGDHQKFAHVTLLQQFV